MKSCKRVEKWSGSGSPLRASLPRIERIARRDEESKSEITFHTYFL